MRHIIKFSFIIFLSLCLLCSCNIEKTPINLQVSDSAKTVFELVSKNYDKSHLLEIWKFSGTLSELDDKYPVECLRKDNSTYRASYLGDDSILVLFFDDLGERTGGFVYNISPPRASFATLSIGQSVLDVKSFDPNGSYLFLYAGSSEIPHESMHFTEDGYMITIEYDQSIDPKIINIKEELI